MMQQHELFLPHSSASPAGSCAGRGSHPSLGTAVLFLEAARSPSRLSLLVSARQPANAT